MITHKIITTKPKISLVSDSSKKENNGLMPITEENYEQYLSNHRCRLGDYVTADYRIGGAENLMHVHYVYDIEKALPNRGISMWRAGYPEVFSLLQLDFTASISRPPWKRKDTAQDMRPLNAEEFQTLIVPHRDNIRDYVFKYGKS